MLPMPKATAKPQLNTELLRSRLKLKHLSSRSTLLAHHPHVANLLTSGALAASLLMSSQSALPALASLPPASENRSVNLGPVDLQQRVAEALASLLPPSVAPISATLEQQISTALHAIFGIHAVAELEGNRLNQSYGLIGAEQHLPRFPGDTVEQHDAIQKSGITPGRGAWGYFAYSKSDLTPDLIEKERYYVAVQTLYLPDWTTRLAYLRDWYKYRKVVVVNPANGKSVVAVVGDSGPAAFTGKHFGGSPEIMAYLNLNVGKQKGPVVLFFVDDPQDQIPLGPLEYNLEKPILPS